MHLHTDVIMVEMWRLESQIVMAVEANFTLEDFLSEREHNEALEYMNSSVIQTLQDYYGLPSIFLIGGIVLHLFGIVFQGFIIAYECWQIDPMEQSFTNLVSKQSIEFSPPSG